MPRRRRIAKSRLLGIEQLSADQRAWFLNDFAEMDVLIDRKPCVYGQSPVFADADEARAAWELHRDALIEEYQTEHVGEEPWPCREWPAAELDELPIHEDELPDEDV